MEHNLLGHVSDWFGNYSCHRPGVWLGIIIVKQIPEKAYRWFIIITTLIAALLMMI
jgi:hypothetical protein